MTEPEIDEKELLRRAMTIMAGRPRRKTEASRLQRVNAGKKRWSKKKKGAEPKH